MVDEPGLHRIRHRKRSKNQTESSLRDSFYETIQQSQEYLSDNPGRTENRDEQIKNRSLFESFTTKSRYDNYRRHYFQHNLNQCREEEPDYRRWRISYYSHLLKLFEIFILQLESYEFDYNQISFEDFCFLVFRSSTGEISLYI